MSAPAITSTSPASNEQDVVLSAGLEIVFDQPMLASSISNATLSLMGPGQTAVVDADEMIHKTVTAQTGREYIPGRFTFPFPDRVLFTPSRPLRPNVKYTVILVGKDSLLARSYVTNLAGEALPKSYQFVFQTGQLDGTVAPQQSPLPPQAFWEKPKLNAHQVSARLLPALSGSSDRVIELTFPGPVDVGSFNPDDLIIAAEPLLNDPSVILPDGITTEILIQANKITVTVHNVDPAAAAQPPSPPSSAGTGPVPDAGDYAWLDPQGTVEPTGSSDY